MVKAATVFPRKDVQRPVRIQTFQRTTTSGVIARAHLNACHHKTTVGVFVSSNQGINVVRLNVLLSRPCNRPNVVVASELPQDEQRTCCSGTSCTRTSGCGQWASRPF